MEAHLLQSGSGLIVTVLLSCQLSASAKSKNHRCGLHLPLGKLLPSPTEEQHLSVMLWELVAVPQRLPVGLSIPGVAKAGL